MEMEKLNKKLDFIRNLDETIMRIKSMSEPEQIMEAYQLLIDYKAIAAMPNDGGTIDKVRLEALKFAEKYKENL